jgi:uracil-DNA glycosylase
MNTGRTQQIQKIYDDVLNFKKSPLYKYRIENNYKPVIGEGDPYSPIMFIGEAPGKNEAIQGRPFCGASGRLLDELLNSIDVNREKVYIANVVKDRPPENRDPTPKEIELYTPFLDRQIDIIQPKVIVTLGRFSMDYIMSKFGLVDKLQSISTIHGQTFSSKASYGNVNIIPLFHPAAALYMASKKKVLIDDMQKVKKYIKI